MKKLTILIAMLMATNAWAAGCISGNCDYERTADFHNWSKK